MAGENRCVGEMLILLGGNQIKSGKYFPTDFFFKSQILIKHICIFQGYLRCLFAPFVAKRGVSQDGNMFYLLPIYLRNQWLSLPPPEVLNLPPIQASITACTDTLTPQPPRLYCPGRVCRALAPLWRS